MHGQAHDLKRAPFREAPQSLFVVIEKNKEDVVKNSKKIKCGFWATTRACRRHTMRACQPDARKWRNNPTGGDLVTSGCEFRSGRRAPFSFFFTFPFILIFHSLSSMHFLSLWRPPRRPCSHSLLNFFTRSHHFTAFSSLFTLHYLNLPSFPNFSSSFTQFHLPNHNPHLSLSKNPTTLRCFPTSLSDFTAPQLKLHFAPSFATTPHHSLSLPFLLHWRFKGWASCLLVGY